MLSIFISNLASIARFTGRTRPAKFWPYVAGVIVLWFVGGMAFMSVEFLRIYGAMSAYIAQNPQASVETGPGSYSVEITGDHPELLPNLEYLLLTTSVAGLCVIFLLAAAVTRRLHDRNMSGFWGLLPLPFLASGLYFMGEVFEGIMIADASFDMIMFVAAFANNLLYIAGLVVLIVLLTGRSTPGDNRFGPQPA